MNRRSLLALIGGAAAMPSVGINAAAQALGVSQVIGVASGLSNEPMAGMGGSGDSWWGSPLQMMLDAHERTRHDMAQGHNYPHMKSWGHGFRTMAVEQDNRILLMYRQKMQEDASFREKILGMLG